MEEVSHGGTEGNLTPSPFPKKEGEKGKGSQKAPGPGPLTPYVSVSLRGQSLSWAEDAQQVAAEDGGALLGGQVQALD